MRRLAAVVFLLTTACAGTTERNARPGEGSVGPLGPGPEAGAPRGSERGLTLDTPPPQEMTPALDRARGQYVHRIGVTIGVDAYTAAPRLDAAVSDARRMAALFKDLGYDTVETLEDNAASRANILDLLGRRIPLLAGPKDLVTVFFAGHGVTIGDKGFILPVDVTKDVAGTAISVQDLKETALRMKAPHVLFLVDACFSGSMFRRGEPGKDTNSLAFWETAAKERVIQVMTAGGPNETVLEDEGWGAFTKSVHAGLLGGADANRDAVVTVEELAGFVTAQVETSTQRHQHPLWGNLEGTGTVLLWDARRVPEAMRAKPAAPRPLVKGMEEELTRVHRLMDAKEWGQAEKLVRDLALKREHVELNLLLAEIYLEQDALGNAALAEAELKRAAALAKEPEEERRLLDLRARLEKARRGPF